MFVNCVYVKCKIMSEKMETLPEQWIVVDLSMFDNQIHYEVMKTYVKLLNVINMLMCLFDYY